MANKCTFVKLAAVAAAAFTLIGCSTANSYSDLRRAPSTADAVPGPLAGQAVDGFDLDSVRFVRAVDGTRLYLARGLDLPVCLLAYRAADDWQSACGSAMTTIESANFEVMIVKDGMPTKDGWTKVGENILLKDR